MEPTEKNEAQEYATMDDEERKQFAQTKDAGGQPGQPRPLSFGDPRDPDHMGADPQPQSAERVEEEKDEMAESGAIGEGSRHDAKRKTKPGQ